MKNTFAMILIAASVMTTQSAFAFYSVPMNILPAARISSVSCQEMVHRGHDYNSAGTVNVLLGNNEFVTMNILVSRFADNEQAEADHICATLEAARKSGQTVDVLFDSDEISNGELEYNIQGITTLFGGETYGG